MLIADGRARVEVAAHDMGMGTATVQSQIAADRLGLNIDRVSVGYGDSTMPGRFIATGSSQSAGIGGAVIAATRKLVDELSDPPFRSIVSLAMAIRSARSAVSAATSSAWICALATIDDA